MGVNVINSALFKYYDKYRTLYHSSSQLIRLITEKWFEDNMYYPFCHENHLKNYQNNFPVADFYCHSCGENFQLKSKKKSLGRSIVDGEYNKMIEAVMTRNVPNFLFLNYTVNIENIVNLVIVPKEFILPITIHKRKPLSSDAKRAGWVGCNILLDKIPDYGKIYAIKDNMPIAKSEVRKNVRKVNFFRKEKDLTSRGWLNDILLVISKIKTDVFNLNDIYKHVDTLKEIHPYNNNIQAKIRQQLQILRDHGIIEFIGRGVYKKL